MSHSDLSFEELLTGGHPNSLGNTIQVVEMVLADQSKIEELYQCYFSQDEVVRLRVSNAFKRICQEKPEWVAAYLDKLLTEITRLDQSSAQWTLAQLFDQLSSFMTTDQLSTAKTHLKKNLANHTDWIVLNQTMQTLFEWSKSDADLQAWLRPHLERLSKDTRKSISNRIRRRNKADPAL